MIDPSAFGNLTSNRMRSGEPPNARIIWISTGSTERIPTIVFTKIGKKQMSATRTTFDSMPKPNQTMTRGASATLGTDWSPTTNGKTKRSAVRDSATMAPERIATPEPRA